MQIVIIALKDDNILLLKNTIIKNAEKLLEKEIKSDALYEIKRVLYWPPFYLIYNRE